MIFYVYKIILTDGRFAGHYYIGQRSYKGKNIEEDTYKGSGKILKSYYKKHPNGYKKEILEIVPTKAELNEREKFYAGDLWETDPLCVNLTPGGKFVTDLASFKGINKGRRHTEEEKQHLREIMTGRKRGSYKWTEEGLKKIHSPKSPEASKNMRKKHKMSKEGVENLRRARIESTGKPRVTSIPIIVYYGDNAYICSTITEAAEFAQCSVSTVKKYRRTGLDTDKGFSFKNFN